jgi:hypothetical protein
VSSRPAGNRGDVVDRAIEGRLVRARRLREPAQLPDELQEAADFLSVAGGSKLNSVLMLRHMGWIAGPCHNPRSNP